MIEILTLKRQDAYTVYASIDDMRNANKGVYSDYSSANAASIKAGAWGEDGSVKNLTVWADGEGNIYELKPLGKYTDIEANQREKILSEIKGKLSASEQKFLNL